MQRDTSEVLRLPRKMAIEVSKVLRLPRKNATHFLRESIALATQNNFRHFCRHMRMSRNATPVTQNDITTSLALLPPTRTGFAFPPWRGQKKTRDSRRDTLEHQNEHFVRDFLQFSHFVASKLAFSYGFLMNLKICYLKIDVSCEASVNFQHISQNATPATQFAPCRHLTQP